MTPEQVLSSTASPAFAVDGDLRIVGMNRPAELLLGYDAAEVRGKPCYELLCGKDPFGNDFCHENCSISTMTRRREPVSNFEVQVQGASGGRVDLSVSIVSFDSPNGSGPVMYHLFQILKTEPCLHPSPGGRSSTGDSVVNPARAAGGNGADGPSAFMLTPREIEVLRLLTLGRSVTRIAGELHISVVTVRNHVHRIHQKLDVHSQAEAVAFALRNGLV
jgi:PAS domain S-box-containing protein